MLAIQAPILGSVLKRVPTSWKAIVLLLSTGLGLSVSLPAQALPGETVRDVQSWIKAHPTLLPDRGEALVVQKSDTAAQRFKFEASIFPPFPVTTLNGSRVIRHESISLFDMINGVNPTRLEESLRVIYGVDIAQDYDRARVIYRYPQDLQLDRLQQQLTTIQRARQGELRLGDRYAYWLEIVQTPEGRPYNGQVVVLLKEDLDGLEAQLRQ
ncbi:MAG: hypothetical protein ACO3EZ_15620 [Prochlorotrichaceae cyanobacterium]